MVDENPVHIYQQLGDYTLTLTATSAKGCQDMVSMVIGVVTGTEGVSNHEIKVYPNPVETNPSLLNVSAIKMNGEISLFNAQGYPVFEAIAVDADEHTLDVSDLPNGIYILKFTGPQDTVTKKIVIAR